MKFLCLAYGNEKAWNALDEQEQATLLAQDELMRKRGDVVSAVKQDAAVVTAWEGLAEITDGPYARSEAPLAGFGIVEAKDFDEAVRLVSRTPCAVAKGAVEIREITEINF